MANKQLIKIDIAAGSRSYNRLDMQVSQTLHMAIELYDELNYLLILDHYDDITLFDLDSDPLVVSYYQMKTCDEIITIDSAISSGWLAKLYMQLSRPENWLVKELGLITNTPLEINYTLVNENGRKLSRKNLLKAEKTPLSKLQQSVQDRIKADIASRLGMSSKEVDLSKFAHLHTTLTIDRHKDLVEKEMQDFIYEKYPRITVDTVKGLYSSLIDILTKRQEYERMQEGAELDEVKIHKGFTRDEMSRVIDKVIMLSIPTFDDMFKFSGVKEEDRTAVSLPFVQILADSNNPKDESFRSLYNETLEVMEEDAFDGSSTPWEYGLVVGTRVHDKNPLLKIPYNQKYIAVLTVCLLINKLRKNP